MKNYTNLTLKNIMNLNVISQLLTTFVVVLIGPALIAYLAYKKAL
jgi:hypothetical protein